MSVSDQQGRADLLQRTLRPRGRHDAVGGGEWGGGVSVCVSLCLWLCDGGGGCLCACVWRVRACMIVYMPVCVPVCLSVCGICLCVCLCLCVCVWDVSVCVHTKRKY